VKKKAPAREKPLPWLLTEREWQRFSRDPEAFRGKVTYYLQDAIIPAKVYSVEEMREWCRTPTNGSREANERAKAAGQ
jgi:hypothetical protein